MEEYRKDALFWKNNRSTNIQDIERMIKDNDVISAEVDEVEDGVIDKLDVNFDIRKSTSIGRGHRGRIYKAVYKGMPVILRTFTMSHSKDNMEIFTREFEMVRRSDHPNLSKFYGYFQSDNTVFLVSENAKYVSLYDRMHTTGRLSLKDTVDICLGIVEGLIYIRDYFGEENYIGIKPHNVMIDDCGVAKITEFGLNCSQRLDFSYSQSLFEGVRWMTPETLIPKRIMERSCKSDVYSLGVLIWEMLTGETPYASVSNYLDIIDLIIGRHLLTIPDTCNETLRNVIRNCWTDDPLLRPRLEDIKNALLSIIVQ